MVEETEESRFLEVTHIKTYKSEISDVIKCIETSMMLDLYEIAFYEQDINLDTEELTNCTLIYSKSGLVFKIVMEYEEFKKIHIDFFDKDHFFFPNTGSKSN